MHSVARMMSANPSRAKHADHDFMAECVELCLACEQTCLICADACIGEKQPEMLRRCIRLNLDCADVCGATGRLLSRLAGADPSLLRAQLEVCLRACATCGAECQRHAEQHEHCRICAEVCRACEEHGRRLLSDLPDEPAI